MNWQAQTSQRTMHVLVVDPDSVGRGAAVQMLKKARDLGGMRISLAGGVAEALLGFRRDHPDLVLIRGSSFFPAGIEITRAIRASEETRHTGVVISGTTPEDDAALSVVSLEEGADDFLRSDCSELEMAARIASVLRLKAMTDRLRQANHRLEQLSLTDELTGLNNMRSFDVKYSDLMKQCESGATAAAVVMMDLDHFKSVNDQTNHLVGSYVISEVGGLLRTSHIFKEKDILARFGGDEFIFALAGSDFEAAKIQIEAVRQLVESHAFSCDGYTVRLTVSLGMAWVDKGFRGNAQDVVKAADLMLYRSKNLGRNRLSSMVLTYPVNLDMELARRLARRGSMAPETSGAPSEALDLQLRRKAVGN